MLSLTKKQKILFQNVFILSLMMVLAACGLIYEYIFSHYAGRVLGSLETVLYSIIGIMIVSMGMGALLASKIKEPFFSLSVLESLIAIIAIVGIFVISGTHSLAFHMPYIVAETFSVPVDSILDSSGIEVLHNILTSTSYIMAGLVGVMIGMEIPLVARIREVIYQEHKEDNFAVVYGFDYIGAGIGAFLWVAFLIKMDISYSMGIIATTNVLCGFVFLIFFKEKIKRMWFLVALQFFTSLVIFYGVNHINQWQDYLEDSLYADEKIFSKNTKFQRIAVTRGLNPYDNEYFYNFFINGRTQFSQMDEIIYHSLLTYPVLNFKENIENVLVIGGGDGLAMRDILHHNPKGVTMLDLDKEIVDFFRMPYYVDGEQINKALIELNENSLNDRRIEFLFGDAYLSANKLLYKNKKFDAIIIDLPDPSHPDLNKLYSKPFYRMMNNLLAEDGAMIIQSTSPYYAKNAFLSIKKTVESAHFSNVEQLKHNVPSFGEWGFTVASKNGQSIKEKMKNIDHFKVKNSWLNKDILIGSFAFGNEYYSDYEKIKINREGSGVVYTYHQQAWEKSNGYYEIN